MFEEVDIDEPALDPGRCYSRESFKNLVDAEYNKSEKAREKNKTKRNKNEVRALRMLVRKARKAVADNSILSWKKEYIQKVAEICFLPKSGTKEDIVDRISAYFESHLEDANEEEFVPNKQSGSRLA